MIISLDDAKAHLNITTDDDDELITSKIEAAQEWLERFLGYNTLDVDTVTPPEPVKEAARQIVAHLYENREASVVGVSADLLPFGVHELIADYRTWEF